MSFVSQVKLGPTGLPQFAFYNQREIACTVFGLRDTFDHWARNGLLDASHSLGIAVSQPNPVIGQPTAPWFATGWGPGGAPYPPYLIGAVNALHGVLMTGKDTLTVRQEQTSDLSEGSAALSTVLMGCGTLIAMGGKALGCAVDGRVTGTQALWLAQTIGGRLLMAMHDIDHSLPKAMTPT